MIDRFNVRFEDTKWTVTKGLDSLVIKYGQDGLARWGHVQFVNDLHSIKAPQNIVA
jgi:hypothetical protein